MITLAHNRYGKSRVRLVKVTRHPGRDDFAGHHDLHEWTVEILLEGDFLTAHTVGDNSLILPTDTMKNTVYSLARDSAATSIESFAIELSDYLLARNPQVSTTHIHIESTLWKRLTISGGPHATSFMRGSDERQTTVLRHQRGASRTITSGLHDLVIMKTANSGFEHYIQDSLTTLKETPDRLFATALTADWAYTESIAQSAESDFHTPRHHIRESMLHTFADHQSLSVQHTLYAMGEDALNTTPSITQIHLLMPNKHCNLIDLTRFNQDNPNQIFVPTDEPHGTIEATIHRA